MSSGAASIKCAARRLALSCTFSVALRIAVPPTARLRLPPVLLAKVVDVGELERLGERTVVLAAVVPLSGRRLIGERVGWDEVASAHDLGRVLQLGGDAIDQPLEVVRRLRPARTAIRGD